MDADGDAVTQPSPDDTPHCDRACRTANLTWHRAGGGAVLPLGWTVPSAYYTYLENFQADVAYSPSLYAVAEPELMRRKFALTAAMARGSKARGGEVVPYIMLGMGLRRVPLLPNGTSLKSYNGGYTAWEVDYQYDEGYDFLLGAEMHAKQYEHSAMGPWGAAAAAVFFPSPFDETHYGNWPSRHTEGSTNSMDHFIAYTRGAQLKSDDDAETVPIFGTWEAQLPAPAGFTAAGSPVYNITQLDAVAVVTTPDAQTIQVRGFFMIPINSTSAAAFVVFRFTPSQAGAYTVSITVNDGAPVSRSFTVTGSASLKSEFVLLP